MMPSSIKNLEKDLKIHHQLTSNQLADSTVKLGMGTLTKSGALAIATGKFTGRSPKDRYIVKDQISDSLV